MGLENGLFLLHKYHTGCIRFNYQHLLGSVKSCIVHALKDGTVSDGKKISGITCPCGDMISTQFAVHATLLPVEISPHLSAGVVLQ